MAKSDKNLRRVDAMIDEPITIEFDNNRLLPELYGEHGKNLVRIEQALGVSIANRGNQVFVSGDAAARAGPASPVAATARVVCGLSVA